MVVVTEDCDKVFDAQDSLFDGLLFIQLFCISVHHGTSSALLDHALAGATSFIEVVLSSLSMLDNRVTSILLKSLTAIVILLIIDILGLTSWYSCLGCSNPNQSCVFAIRSLINITSPGLSLRHTGHHYWFLLFEILHVLWFQSGHQYGYQNQGIILYQVCDQYPGQNVSQSKLYALKSHSFGIWLKTNEF